MMKDSTWIFLVILLNHTAGYSQRYDFNWVFGYAGGQGDTRWGTTKVDFNQGNPLITFIPQGKLYLYDANASIADQDGNLLYYSNGYDVEDANFKKVQGATNLGTRYWGDGGLVCNQGVMFLPMPSNANNYYLFYVNKVLNSPNFYVLDLKYLIINIDSNSVIKKGVVVHDTLNEGCLSACKHANGRDWWIILNKANTNIFYKFLITDSGIVFIDKQAIGPQFIEGVGQALFSPNGEYFAIYESISNREGAYFYLYNFNRCTGSISELQNSHIGKMGLGGISFSPDSKLFYHSSGLLLSQTSIQQANPLDAFEEIEIITDQTPWGSQYFIHQLGPDGRIYISNAYSNFVIHRINKPNERGVDCLPRSNSFVLKTLGRRGVPNMPNFRLGPIDGSSCDTLG
ncbi:MAG: hypothetical protein M3Q56_02755, partial [Bacteroidota bacterium]|nr:hypothetical protein [Bacteroidota bacterium]